MSHKILLEPRAKVDIMLIRDWCRLQKPGLEDEFTSELLENIELLKQNPYLFQIRFPATRVLVLKKFPYLVYYLISNAEVHIIAVIGAKQDQYNIIKHR